LRAVSGVSIELQVAANAPFGDYTLRLQSNSGETAYVPGAITIDPGVGFSRLRIRSTTLRFFITQQYADLTGREPDQAGLKTHAQLNCVRSRATVCARAESRFLRTARRK
jgi:hypothetical protein